MVLDRHCAIVPDQLSWSGTLLTQAAIFDIGGDSIRRFLLILLILFLICFFWSAASAQKPALQLNDLEYFEMPGTNVMVFQDIHPEGHQGGVTLIQNGVRIACNGDLRLEPTPGQWQPIPKQDRRLVNREGISGIFPRQADGASQIDKEGEFQPVPLAAGRRLSIAPELEAQQLSIESRTGNLQLLDGRNKHNKGSSLWCALSAAHLGRRLDHSTLWRGTALFALRVPGGGECGVHA
jgi:hypothetical protein